MGPLQASHEASHESWSSKHFWQRDEGCSKTCKKSCQGIHSSSSEEAGLDVGFCLPAHTLQTDGGSASVVRLRADTAVRLPEVLLTWESHGTSLERAHALLRLVRRALQATCT